MNNHDVQSTVSAVTVYQGRAMITRSATATIPAGPAVVRFADLPADLDRESIQVRGNGPAILGECTVEEEVSAEDVDARRRELEEQRRTLEDRLEELQLRLESGTREKQVLEKIVDFVTAAPAAPAAPLPPPGAAPSPGTPPVSPSSAASPDRGSPDSWGRIVTFYREQNQKIDRTGLELRASIRDIHREIETVQAQLDNLGYRSQRRRAAARVRLEMESAGEIRIELSYVVHGPTWRPVYNLRAGADAAQIDVEYDAIVTQATAEDWTDVDIRLSTARVSVSGVLPELSPWRLRIARPEPVLRRMKKERDRSYDEVMEEEEESYKMAASMAAPAPEMAEDLSDLRYESAQVENSGAAAEFVVAGGGSVGGDNTEARLPITRERLPGTFRYAAVPKLAEYAYLRAEMENSSAFPFLPGRANVFLNGAYVAASALPLVMPGETTEISLGIDEGVRVEYRLLTRFAKKGGIASRRSSRRFDYEIRITNNRPRTVDVTVYDQFPIPEDKEITVKPLQPQIKGNESWITIDDESKIEWRFELEKGATKELPYSVLVEYPSEAPPYGL